MGLILKMSNVGGKKRALHVNVNEQISNLPTFAALRQVGLSTKEKKNECLKVLMITGQSV